MRHELCGKTSRAIGDILFLLADAIDHCDVFQEVVQILAMTARIAVRAAVHVDDSFALTYNMRE
jgi:hypothetical protein